MNTESLLKAAERHRDDLQNPDVVDADKVKPMPVRWLWPKRIPRGVITLLAGDPEAGKSTIAWWIVAQVTNGTPWPDSEDQNYVNEPGDVLIIQAEEDVPRAMVPRLIAAGADLSRVKIVDLSESRFTLKDGADVLDRLLGNMTRPTLVVVDTWGSASGVRRENDSGEIVAVVGPLKRVAEKYGVTVLLLCHFRKRMSGPQKRTFDLAEIAGSRALGGAARAAFAVLPHGDLRVVRPLKSSLAAPPPDIAFRIAGKNVQGVHGEYAAATPCEGGVSIDGRESVLERERHDLRQRESVVEWVRQKGEVSPAQLMQRNQRRYPTSADARKFLVSLVASGDLRQVINQDRFVVADGDEAGDADGRYRMPLPAESPPIQSSNLSNCPTVYGVP